MTRTDSKAGTPSDFYIAASANDWLYGQTGAMNPASTHPDNAVRNAAANYSPIGLTNWK